MIKINTRHKILKIATKLFAKNGYERTTIKEIAQNAEVAEGTIFVHFATKKELLEEVVTTGIEKFADSFLIDPLKAKLEESEELPLKEQFKTLLLNRAQVITKYSNLLKIIFEEAQYNPKIKQSVVENVIKKKIEIGESFIEHNKDQFRDINSLVVLRSIIGMVGMMILQRNLIPEKNQFENIEEEIENIIDILFYGIKKNENY